MSIIKPWLFAILFCLAATVFVSAQENEIKFGKNRKTFTFKGVVEGDYLADMSNEKHFTAKKGQILTMQLNCAPVKFCYIHLDGTLENDNIDISLKKSRFLRVRLPETGEYSFMVSSSKRAQYSLTISLK